MTREEWVDPVRQRCTVAVVLVTYGSRDALLASALEGLDQLADADRVQRIIIVDNGSSETSKDFLARLARHDPRVEVITHGANLGSAGGFRAGLNVAVDSGCNLIWILDDDNRPEPDALSALLREITTSSKPSAFLSLRTSRPQYVRYAAGASRVACFGTRDAFLGFSWRKIGDKILHRNAPSRHDLTTASENLQVPYAPYGGLFLHREVLKDIGLPREDFFLYGDDHEFTHRLTRRGVPIFLVPDSRLIDLDSSWNLGTEEGPRRLPFDNFVTDLSDKDIATKIYYSVRNRTYFETRYLVHRPWTYSLNLVSVLVLVVSRAVARSVVMRRLEPVLKLRSFVRGISDGLIGRLGRHS